MEIPNRGLAVAFLLRLKGLLINMGLQTSNSYPLTPLVGVGAITIKDEKVLMVKRGVEPSYGLWAIPGGTLKLGESMRQCAEREMLEETGGRGDSWGVGFVF